MKMLKGDRAYEVLNQVAWILNIKNLSCCHIHSYQLSLVIVDVEVPVKGLERLYLLD